MTASIWSRHSNGFPTGISLSQVGRWFFAFTPYMWGWQHRPSKFVDTTKWKYNQEQREPFFTAHSWKVGPFYFSLKGRKYDP